MTTKFLIYIEDKVDVALHFESTNIKKSISKESLCNCGRLYVKPININSETGLTYKSYCKGTFEKKVTFDFLIPKNCEISDW